MLRLVGQDCEVHLGRAPGALVTAVQGVVDVVGLGHVRHEVGGRAEPVPAGEEELSAWRQVVGAHDVPGVHRQGQGVAVHTCCARGVGGQDHALSVSSPLASAAERGASRCRLRTNELPSCEARPGRRVNNSAAAGKLQGGELREDCVEGALERGLAG